ncbi:MAG TPA: hypothetical protein VFM17_06815 [Candidatus Eisenbacteria bacterium]|nr:hypothetical protein [Candidatus Eisenbacteria bacterium]
MKLAWIRLVSMAAAAPLAVSVSTSSQDSAVTSLSVSMGAGSYAHISRGCEGQVLDRYQHRFQDAGVTLHHDFRGAPEAGLRVTILRKMPYYEDGTVVWNPYAAMEWERFGFGAGFIPDVESMYYLYGNEDFEILPVSAHIRAGRRDGFHFSVHMNDQAPLVSAGGPYRLGFGFRPARRVGAWLGMGTPDPFDRAGFVAKADINVFRYLDVNAIGRLGGSEGLSENAGAVGVTFKFPWGESRPAPVTDSVPGLE